MEIIKTKKITYCFSLICLAIFLWGSITKLNLPLAEWDHVCIDAAENWSKGVNKIWRFDHPPLYPFWLTILFKSIGQGAMTARLGNVFCVLLTALFLFRLTSKIYNRDAALWATCFYLLSPVCIQGISSTDMADTSLLPLIFVLTINVLRNNTLNPRIKNTLFLGFWIGICFWAKVTSGIALIISSFAGSFILLLFEKKNKNYKLFLFNIAGLSLGAMFFLVTWFCVSNLLWGSEAFLIPLKTPWIAIHSRFEQPSFFSRLLSTGYYTFRIFVWFSPFFLIMWLNNSWAIIKNSYKLNANQDNFKILLIFLTVIYFVGYIFIGGTNWGFPRYHVAILPLVCIFVGLYVSNFIIEMKKKELLITILTILILIVLYALAFNDPLFFLNLQLKEILLYNYGKENIVKETFVTFIPLYGIPIIITLLLMIFLRIRVKSKLFTICLFVGSLTTIVSIDIQQILASYRTSYQYGAKGKIELVQKVRSHINNGDYVFATPEFVYELRDKKVPQIGWRGWESKERFYQFIKHKTPIAIIAGLTVNTYQQLKWLFSKDTQLFLSKCYKFERIGTYYLWLRKPKAHE